MKVELIEATENPEDEESIDSMPHSKTYHYWCKDCNIEWSVEEKTFKSSICDECGKQAINVTEW